MGCGPIKGRITVPWSTPPVGTLKFNVDSASRVKSGPAGVRGVPRNSNCEALLMLSKNVGVCDSNEAEVLAILEALCSPKVLVVGFLWKVILLMR